VLVSGLLKPASVPGRVYDLIADGRCEVIVSGLILAEYGRVLNRPKFHFPRERIADVLEFLQFETLLVYDIPLRRKLPDPDDLVFLAAAYHHKADALVSGNLRDFPTAACKPVRVLNPFDFLKNFT
jgi:putative PIN family toxin of toxin-antitoxin system